MNEEAAVQEVMEEGKDPGSEAQPQEDVNASEDAESLRRDLLRTRESLAYAERQLALYRNNLVPPQPAQQPQPQNQPDMFSGLEDDEVVQVKQLKAIMNHALNEERQKIAQAFGVLNQERARDQLLSKYPDFFKVMQEHLIQLNETDPQTAQWLVHAPPQALNYAYLAAKKAKEPEVPVPSKTDAQKKIDNAQKPQFTGVQQIGGGATNFVEMIRNMSPEEVGKYWTRYRGEIRAKGGA